MFEVAMRNVFLLLFQYLLFSVTDPQFRVKPAEVSDVSPPLPPGRFEVSLRAFIG